MNRVKSLVFLGRLGYRPNPQNYFKIILKDDFSPLVQKLTELLLVFDGKIRYIKKIKIHRSENDEHWLKLDDLHLLMELRGQRVKLAILKDDYFQMLQLIDNKTPLGKPVVFETEKLGVVEEVLENPYQKTLVVKSEGKGKMLIPFVDEYVKGVTKKRVEVKNVQRLLNL